MSETRPVSTDSFDSLPTGVISRNPGRGSTFDVTNSRCTSRQRVQQKSGNRREDEGDKGIDDSVRGNINIAATSTLCTQLSPCHSHRNSIRSGQLRTNGGMSR